MCALPELHEHSCFHAHVVVEQYLVIELVLLQFFIESLTPSQKCIMEHHLLMFLLNYRFDYSLSSLLDRVNPQCFKNSAHLFVAHNLMKLIIFDLLIHRRACMIHPTFEKLADDISSL